MTPIPNSHEEWTDIDRAIRNGLGSGVRRESWDRKSFEAKKRAILLMLNRGTLKVVRFHGHYDIAVREM